jgi:tetratricopeptide (TPR) repeat protein
MSLSSFDTMDLTRHLGQLETAQLVRHLAEEDVAYIFKHALTQETAYYSLLQRQRREIHLRVAQVYEQLYADRLDEHAALLAQHYERAGDDAMTFEYAVRAGDTAARVYANVEAIAHYSRALEIAKRSSDHHTTRHQDLYLKLGRMYELNDRHDRALAVYAEMETHARECNDRAMELAGLMARATIYSIPSPQFDTVRAQALCDQALTLARAIGDQPAEAKILWNLVLLNTRLGTRYRQAIDYGDQAIAIARACGLQEQLAYLLNDLSLPLVWIGEVERGIAVNLEAREMWRAMGNLPMLADNLSYAVMSHISLGEHDQAIDEANQARQISQSIGNVWGESFSQSWVGEAYREIGHIEQAIIRMENSVRLAPQSFQAPLSFTRADLGCLLGDLGQVARGLELARLAHIAGSRLAQVMRFYTAAQLIHLHLLAGDIASAVTLFDEMAPLVSVTDHVSLFGTGLSFAEVELALAQKDFPRAVRASTDLIQIKRTHRLRQAVPNALYLKARALQSMNQFDQAQAALLEAQIEAEQTNSRWMLWRILAALAEVEHARGDLEQAQILRGQAREIIEYIATHTPPELRESFLNLPDVRALFVGRDLAR